MASKPTILGLPTPRSPGEGPNTKVKWVFKWWERRQRPNIVGFETASTWVCD